MFLDFDIPRPHADESWLVVNFSRISGSFVRFFLDILIVIVEKQS